MVSALLQVVETGVNRAWETGVNRSNGMVLSWAAGLGPSVLGVQVASVSTGRVDLGAFQQRWCRGC